jgi:hypothetical protein
MVQRVALGPCNACNTPDVARCSRNRPPPARTRPRSAFREPETVAARPGFPPACFELFRRAETVEPKPGVRIPREWAYHSGVIHGSELLSRILQNVMIGD